MLLLFLSPWSLIFIFSLRSIDGALLLFNGDFEPPTFIDFLICLGLDKDAPSYSLFLDLVWLLSSLTATDLSETTVTDLFELLKPVYVLS